MCYFCLIRCNGSSGHLHADWWSCGRARHWLLPVETEQRDPIFCAGLETDKGEGEEETTRRGQGKDERRILK